MGGAYHTFAGVALKVLLAVEGGLASVALWRVGSHANFVRSHEAMEPWG